MAGIATEVCNHTFRGAGITAYLENGTLEKARQMAAHATNARNKKRPPASCMRAALFYLAEWCALRR